MEEDDDSVQSSPAVVVAADKTVTAPEPSLASPVHIQKPKASGPPAGGGGGGGGGGREDCWSDGATEALIDAWGERFLELSRGNLKQKHWQEVADVVSSRQDYTRPPKSDAQCKNRIDTLKKKYKLEKSKIAAASSPSCSSSWPFFSRLDELVCRNPHNRAPAEEDEALPPKCNFQLPQLSCKKKRSKKKSHRQLLRKLPPVPKRDSTSSGTLPQAATNGGRKRFVGGARIGARAERGFYGKGLREMTEAIVKFGEVYERVERSKLRQAAEMEKQRMVLAKELELQRMQFFMKTQLELTQLKRNGRRREIVGEGGGSHDSNNNSDKQ